MTKLPAMIAVVLCLGVSAAYAVRTSFVEHSSEAAFRGGEPNQVLISSTGELSLGYQSRELLQDVEGVWLVNAIVQAANGDVYVATSGQGGIYRLREGVEAEQIYGKDPNDARRVLSLALDGQGRLLAGTGGEQGKLLRLDGQGEATELYADEDIQYVWSIVVGPAGRIYLATGTNGQIVTLDADGQNGRVVYDAPEKNLLALALDDQGILYAGTDEKGLIYRVDPSTKEGRVVYDTNHSEISGLVFDEAGNLYASTADADAAKPGAKLILSNGETSRPETEEDSSDKPDEAGDAGEAQAEGLADETATDSAQGGAEDAGDLGEEASTDGDEADEREQDESEDTDEQGDEDEESPDDALGGGTKGLACGVAGESEVAGTVALSDTTTASVQTSPGGHGVRVCGVVGAARAGDLSETALPARQLRPAATQVGGQGVASGGSQPGGAQPSRGPGQTKANEVYKITPQGYVTSIFNKPVVILALAYAGNGQLLLATGNDGQLLRLDVEKQEGVVLHDDEQSAQVCALYASSDGRILAGLANPGGALMIDDVYAPEGIYESSVIDAKQISRWGTLALAADLGGHTTLDVSTRSGNTRDAESGAWEAWTVWRPVTDEAAIRSATGRFLQYRLRFASTDAEGTPTVRQVKVAYMIPNLPPKVANLKVAAAQGQASNKRNQGSNPQAKKLAVTWQAADANNDVLTFGVYVRQEGGGPWIKLAEDLGKPQWAWDTLTVADGRYELKVVASDEPSNAESAALSGVRISAPVVVDNTGVEVEEVACVVEGRTVHVTGRVRDELSVIRAISYCLDSEETWQSVASLDGIYDTRSEGFAFDVTAESAGQHLLALRFDDASGNTVYRNFIIEVP